MPDTLNRQRGFSLPEVILAMALLVITVTTLSGYQRALMTSLVVRAQYQQLWRYGWQQTALYSFSPPESWQANRMQTTQAGCVSISVKLISPLGRQGQMSRLHCPKSQ
ncbi:prepilin-type N-terminal cleavage/methylation domain-containing protein [Citrobacter koseri]|uniref:prepilin-type N-terminal cleavage/methylation domain-containing protein n=1 Tax=Citrobacter koseri TaxID=545 RepID=UPI000D7C9393|nr:prepilin-type N-terminal cleavage/methylation domain-containing protein [Citrobacter koseri]PYZ77589.1 prepilin-type N-terminal cleavage/methylation domain-containing protein [Citrobacter koseri]